MLSTTVSSQHDQDAVRVETLGGLKPIRITRADDGTMALATVDMGEPILKPALIPTDMRCGTNDDMVIACPLETELGTFDVTPVSMGNPHCVLWVDDVEAAPVSELGPVIENHPLFPNKTNVEFAQMAAETRHPAACVGTWLRRDPRLWNRRMCRSGCCLADAANRTRSDGRTAWRRSGDPMG